MANENMIKFLRGAVANLPATATPGAVYFTKDEGLYLGLEDGSFHRYGDFIIVNDVASLPTNGAHETCAYYCVSENILARFDKSTNTWTQINKQKTLAELGGVAKTDYDEKMTALEQADTDNATAISGVDTRLQAAEEKLKSVATTEGLGDLTDRVTTAEGEIDALQADSHTHGFDDSDVEDAIAKKHAHTFVDTDVEDAISKKHAHTFNETELNKIVAGDVAKWNGVVADHLTSADKTAIEDSIGDVNTALETYKTSNNEALAGVKATAEAAATKEYTDAELAKKVTKTDYEADKTTFATKTELNGVDAKFAQYNTTTAQKAIDDAQDTEIAKKADAEAMTTELGKKVDKVEGKDLIATSEIERLVTLKNYDDTALAGRVTTAEGKITALEGASATHALKSEVEAVDAKFADYTKTADLPTDLGDFTNNAGYAKTADVNTELDKKADKTQVATDIANAIAPLATTEALNGVKATAEAAAVKTEVEAALVLKADKSVVDAMYTNAQIDGFIAEAKKYADDNDADTKYGIVYDSENKKIKLVEGGTDVEIDASAFIKDGMISNVTIGDDNDLVITFNTDAGKENIVLPLDQLVDIYTGVEGTRVKVTVNADKSISADLVAGSIGKDYLDDGVKASLALADSAIQAHQDISHLAVKTQVATDIENAVKAEAERATGVENGLAGRIKDLEDNKAGYATTGEVATAKSEAITAAETKAGELDTALHTAISKEIDDDVAALADTVYTKTEVEAMLTWGTFGE